MESAGTAAGMEETGADVVAGGAAGAGPERKQIPDKGVCEAQCCLDWFGVWFTTALYLPFRGKCTKHKKL